MSAILKPPIDAEFERMLDLPLPKKRGRKPGISFFKPLGPDATVEQALEQLPPRDQNFVRLVISGKRPAEAIRLCGWTGKNPEARAYHLQNKNKRVMQALAIFQRQMQKSGEYGFMEAMGELNATIQFARETENATAMARAVELKTKLAGLMVERHEVKQANFSVNIGGIDESPN